MINNVTLSGKLEYIYELQGDRYLSTISVGDDRFYVVADKSENFTKEIENKYVVVRGSLVNLKIELENNNRRIVAVAIRSIEAYDI